VKVFLRTLCTFSILV